jgi:DNA-binding NarL/FixJ family response regulator
MIAPSNPSRTPCGVAADIAHEFGLTKREGQVLRAAARGKSIKEIAFQIGVSDRDIEYFWRRIFDKLGRSSQLAVMAFLLRRACAQAPVVVVATKRRPS